MVLFPPEALGRWSSECRLPRGTELFGVGSGAEREGLDPMSPSLCDLNSECHEQKDTVDSGHICRPGTS